MYKTKNSYMFYNLCEISQPKTKKSILKLEIFPKKFIMDLQICSSNSNALREIELSSYLSKNN